MGTSAEPTRLALRKLWSDHVIWTREYIVAAVAGTPDADARPAGCSKPGGHRRGHRAVLRPGGRGRADRAPQGAHHDRGRPRRGRQDRRPDAAFATHDARWTANIGEIAAFLAGGQSELAREGRPRPAGAPPQADEGEAVARITGDWAADVKAFDDIFTEIMVVADTLHDGIVAQFPDRFDGRCPGMTAPASSSGRRPATLPIGAAARRSRPARRRRTAARASTTSPTARRRR